MHWIFWSFIRKQSVKSNLEKMLENALPGVLWTLKNRRNIRNTLAQLHSGIKGASSQIRQHRQSSWSLPDLLITLSPSSEHDHCSDCCLSSRAKHFLPAMLECWKWGSLHQLIIYNLNRHVKKLTYRTYLLHNFVGEVGAQVEMFGQRTRNLIGCSPSTSSLSEVLWAPCILLPYLHIVG